MLDPVLQQAITEKGEELQVLTRLSEIYAIQEELLGSALGIPDLPTLQKLIVLKQEEIGMYGLLCGSPCAKDSTVAPKEASRGDELHTPILAFLNASYGEPRVLAQKIATDFIIALPTHRAASGQTVPQELQTILGTLDTLDKPVALEIHTILTNPADLRNFVNKTVYNVDKAKEECVEKALLGFAEMISLAVNYKRELNSLSREGFVNNFMTNAHLLSSNMLKL